MDKLGQKHISSAEPAFYTVLFLILSGVIVVLFRMEGKSFIWLPDGIEQHFPSFSYLCDYLEKIFILRESPSFFNYTIGQGADILTALSPYDFTDPISILMACIFPLDRILRYETMIFLKFWLAGISFIYYCRKAEIKDRSSVITGALIYTFSGCTLFTFARHPDLINWAFFFPAILGSIEGYQRKRDRSFSLIILVFLNSLTSFYTLYMNAILCGIYVLAKMALEIKKDKAQVHQQVATVLHLVGSGIAGVLLSGVIFLPNLFCYLNYARHMATPGYTDSLIMYPPVFYAEFLVDLFNTYGSVPYYSHVEVCFLVVPVLIHMFFGKRFRLEKVLVILSLLMMCIPLAGKILNGFGYPTNRWGYAFVFYLVIAFAGNYPSFCEFLAGKLKCHAGRIRVIYNCMIFGVCFLTAVGFSLVERQNYAEKESVLSEYARVTSVALDDTDDTFFRVEKNEKAENADGINKVHGLSQYWSTVSEDVSRYYHDLGLRTVWQNNRFGELDGRTGLLALAGVRYETCSENSPAFIPYGFDRIESGLADVKIWKNENALPIGYTFDTYLLSEDFEKLDPIEKEQAFLHSVIIDKPMDIIERGDVSDEASEILYQIHSLQGIECEDSAFQSGGGIEVSESGGDIELGFETPGRGELFLYFEDLEFDADQNVLLDVARMDDDRVLFRKTGRLCAPDYQLATVMNDLVFDLGRSDEKEAVIRIHFSSKCSLKFSGVKIITVPLSYYDKQLNKLNQCVLENTYVGNDIVTGDILTPDDRILQFSIPYSRGWTAYVDGNKTEIIKSDIMYMAIPVRAGEHHIELKYRTPWLVPGSIVSLLTLAGLMLVRIRLKRKEKTSDRNETGRDL